MPPSTIAIIKRLHALADKLGRSSGAYNPDVQTLEAAICELSSLSKQKG